MDQKKNQSFLFLFAPVFRTALVVGCLDLEGPGAGGGGAEGDDGRARVAAGGPGLKEHFGVKGKGDGEW